MGFNIEQDIIIGFSKSKKDEIKISHMQNALYNPISFKCNPNQKFSEENFYYNCILAGYRSAFYAENLNDEPFDALIGGNIPLSSNFGSSSALIIAFCLATIKINKFDEVKIKFYNFFKHFIKIKDFKFYNIKKKCDFKNKRIQNFLKK